MPQRLRLPTPQALRGHLDIGRTLRLANRASLRRTRVLTRYVATLEPALTGVVRASLPRRAGCGGLAPVGRRPTATLAPSLRDSGLPPQFRPPRAFLNLPWREISRIPWAGSDQSKRINIPGRSRLDERHQPSAIAEFPPNGSSRVAGHLSCPTSR